MVLVLGLVDRRILRRWRSPAATSRARFGRCRSSGRCGAGVCRCRRRRRGSRRCGGRGGSARSAIVVGRAGSERQVAMYVRTSVEAEVPGATAGAPRSSAPSGERSAAVACAAAAGGGSHLRESEPAQTVSSSKRRRRAGRCVGAGKVEGLWRMSDPTEFQIDFPTLGTCRRTGSRGTARSRRFQEGAAARPLDWQLWCTANHGRVRPGHPVAAGRPDQEPGVTNRRSLIVGAAEVRARARGCRDVLRHGRRPGPVRRVGGR